MNRVKYCCWLLLILSLITSGCAKGRSNQNNEVNKTDAEPRPAIVKQENLHKIKESLIPISVDPGHEEIIYCIKMTDSIKTRQIAVGDYYRKVNVYEFNTQTSKMKEILTNIDYVTLAKWSFDGRYLGLVSGQHLYVYDKSTEEIHDVNKLVNTPSVIYFGWSPDSTAIYTEHVNLPNCDIYKVNEKTGTPVYRVEGNPPYYKGSFKEDLFFGTARITGSTGNDVPITVLLDSQGKIVKTIAEGRFRDSYGNKIVQTGKDHFGLNFISDIENGDGKPLTSEYVYQTAFTPQGELIYTTPGKFSEMPSYQLHILGSEHNEIVMDVSGPHFTIWPDGRFLDIGGYGEERIDMEKLKIIRGELVPLSEDHDKTQISALTVRAIDTYVNLFYDPITDSQEIENNLSQYFINTDEPVKQWALFDLQRESISRKGLSSGETYHMNAKIENITIKKDRATVKAGFGIRDDFGSGWGLGTTYELVKNEGKWYITGLSTFPDSKERQKVERVAKDFIERSQKGKKIIFKDENSSKIYEEIKGKELELGQIQFWRMSEPHVSPDIDTANYAKVYLEMGSRVYKLVLTKKDSRAWNIVSISDQNLYSLF